MIFFFIFRISIGFCEWIYGNNLMIGLQFLKVRFLYNVMVFNYLFIFFQWNYILFFIFSWLIEYDMNLCFLILFYF